MYTGGLNLYYSLPMDAKPCTDADRRRWLELCRLTGERDRIADERDQLRRQLRGAVASGADWPGLPPQELRERLQAATATWAALVDQIRTLHDVDRPPASTISTPPPVLGGIVQVGVPVMRIKR
jgi:hypothetical protein